MTYSVMNDKLGSTPEGKAFLAAIEKAGGKRALANLIGVDLQSIENWTYLSRRVSKHGAVAIEAALDGFKKEDLRPDVKDWSSYKPPRILDEALQSSPRGRGLLLVISKLCGSRKELARRLGCSDHLINNWMVRGYLPKRHVGALLEMPEFEGVTAEMIRPDLY